MQARIPDMDAANGGVMTRFTQLPLGVHLRETATFANYFPGVNQDVVRLLEDSVSGGREFIYLWGGRGSGKTHLLQAVCRLVSGQAQPLAYFPLRETASLSPGILEGVEQLPLVIVDDVDAVAGDTAWERELFHLYNRIRERDGGLIISGSHSPAAIDIALPDLRTRLAAGLALTMPARPRHCVSRPGKGAWKCRVKWRDICCAAAPAI